MNQKKEWVRIYSFLKNYFQIFFNIFIDYYLLIIKRKYIKKSNIKNLK